MRPIDADELTRVLGITAFDCYKCEWGKSGHCTRGGDFEDACIAIEDAPTIALDRPTGQWIHDGYDHPHGVDWMHCSECGRREPHVPAAMTSYCPSCGAKMELNSRKENEMYKEITIQITATELEAEWLKMMIANEIEEADCARDNEELWAKGSVDEELQMQHMMHASEQRQYILLLKNIAKQIEGGDVSK